MSETKKIWQREEIPVEHTWATEDLYPTDEAWEAELATIARDQEHAASFAGKLGLSGTELYEYLYAEEMSGVKISRLANYCMRKADVDTRNPKYQGMVGKFSSVMVGYSAATSFDTPEIMAISDEELDRFYTEEPRLERYRRMLTNMRRRKAHILSPAEEKLLAAAGEMSQAPDTIYGAFTNADLKFPDAIDSEGNAHQLTQGSYIPLVESTDRVLRKSAFETL
ncbi:MAG: oligoendopeptidase F family protein, partial [Ruminococcaceae bacterium]|nr:oligoendopeptidase F family protein [Oscillospiraceae bacterium]